MLPSDRSHAPCFCAFEKMGDHWSVKKQTYVLGRGRGAVEEIEHMYLTFTWNKHMRAITKEFQKLLSTVLIQQLNN